MRKNLIKIGLLTGVLAGMLTPGGYLFGQDGENENGGRGGSRRDTLQSGAQIHSFPVDTAGRPWTLEHCLHYALENNISLKQRKIEALAAQADVLSAKAALFPSLSFSAGQNYVGRYFNDSPETTRNVYSGNYGLSAGWNVYRGGQLKTAVRQKETERKIASLEINAGENNLEMTITQLYIQILYALESVKINEQTMEVTGRQVARARELLAAGSIAKSDLAQLQAQYSSDKYTLVASKSMLDQYRLQLKQLLELGPDAVLEIAIPVIGEEDILAPLPDKSYIFRQALQTRPEVEISRLNIESGELALQIARAGFLPTVSLNVTSGTNHATGSNLSFGKQLKNSWDNTAGINLTIPLYSNRTHRSNVQKAQYQVENNILEDINTRKDLYSAIENLWLDAANAQQQYLSAAEKFRSAGISYELVNEQFNLGMKNIVELVQEKNTYLSSQQEMLQAKYMAVLNLRLLEFYSGEPVSLP